MPLPGRWAEQGRASAHATFPGAKQAIRRPFVREQCYTDHVICWRHIRRFVFEPGGLREARRRLSPKEASP
jgi:hypothetical protein